MEKDQLPPGDVVIITASVVTGVRGLHRWTVKSFTSFLGLRDEDTVAGRDDSSSIKLRVKQRSACVIRCAVSTLMDKDGIIHFLSEDFFN